jgi:putative membrane protein
MIYLANAAVTLVAALHLYFLVLEMFLWTRPAGLKAFGLTAEKAADSAVLAANQGLYNGFLAAGLVWGLVHGAPGFGSRSRCFSCSASSWPGSMAPSAPAGRSCSCRPSQPRSH